MQALKRDSNKENNLASPHIKNSHPHICKRAGIKIQKNVLDAKKQTFFNQHLQQNHKFHSLFNIQQEEKLIHKGKEKQNILRDKEILIEKKSNEPAQESDIVVDERDHQGLNHRMTKRHSLVEAKHKRISGIGEIPYIPYNLDTLVQKINGFQERAG